MTALTQDLVLAALANVQDPSQGRDIVALGMVTGLQIKDSNISFALPMEMIYLMVAQEPTPSRGVLVRTPSLAETMLISSPVAPVMT